MPTHDIVLGTIQLCGMCKKGFDNHSSSALSDFVKPCVNGCIIHKQCFVDALISDSRCFTCQNEFGKINMSLPILVGLLEKYMLPLLSGIFFMLPLLCVGALNIFNIITWHTVRASIHQNLNLRQQMISHVICLAVPILTGYLIGSNGIYLSYVIGIEYITSYIISIYLTILYAIFFIASNLILFLIVGNNISVVFTKAKNIICHIEFFKMKHS